MLSVSVGSPLPNPSETSAPTPSLAVNGTVPSSSADGVVNPPHDTRRKAPLSRCARNSTITVTPCRTRYICCSVSNWPREHPSELCGGNDQLDAFLRIHAPDLHIITTEQYGSTNPATTVLCQQQHLPQLLNLRGKTSPEHGISTPLNLHCDVQLMGTQTCTFCWSPGHGAHRCPHRASATSPVLPTSHLPACRHCYPFAHHASACRETTTVTCKLCEVQGHATHACSHFKPSKRSLIDFLKPRTAPGAQSSSQVAAPILSATQLSSQMAWQRGSDSVVTSTPSSPTTPYVTPEQLQQALAPLTQALQEIMFRLSPLLALTAHSLSTSAGLTSVVSSPLPLNGQ